MGQGAMTSNWLEKRFRGKVLMFSGKFEKALDYWARPIVPRAGAVIQEEVTPDLSYLVTGARGSAADEKHVARLTKKGVMIDVINEVTLLQLMTPTREESLEILRTGGEVLDLWRTFMNVYRYFGRYDLSESNLQNLDLSGLDLSSISLSGSNLSGVRAVGTSFGSVSGINFDHAVLIRANLNPAGPCTFRHARFEGCNMYGKAGGSDFSFAKFAPGSFHLTAPNSSFVSADLSGSEIHGAELSGSDFTSADLQKTGLMHAKLTEAKLCQANLSGANLLQAGLTKADLTGANLAGADLFAADFRSAIVRGADFTGADVTAVFWDGANTQDATGIAPDPVPGPHLSALEDTARRAKLSTSVTVHDGSAEAVLTVSDATAQWTGRSSNYFRSKGYGVSMMLLARRFKTATPRFDSVTVHTGGVIASDPSVTRLPALTLQGWFEAFGLPQPPEHELSRLLQPQSEYRDRLLVEELTAGPPGILIWNSRSRTEIKRAGSFPKADLRNARMAGVKLSDVEFPEAVFDGADLTGAKLDLSNFTQASFQRAVLANASLAKTNAAKAILKGAQLTGAILNDANLAGADLSCADLTAVQGWKTDFTKADLSGANLAKASLNGADMRGCRLTGATLQDTILQGVKYDARTVFPEGLTPPIEMQWAGSGTNPFFETKSKPDTPLEISFDTFIKNLRANTQPQAFHSALQMLKSQRFQLFSDAGEGEVIGVVRSQTDKDLVYSCRLTSEGAFSCCTQNLKPCGGLRGKLCKHTLVMVVGLAKAGKLTLQTADRWILNSRRQKPILDKEKMTDTFLRYTSAQAGEIDWRPTETVPEDYLAL